MNLYKYFPRNYYLLLNIIILILVLLCPRSESIRTFPISTEIQLPQIQPFLHKAPPGLYITVGGERAFRGASMFPEIDHLIILDICPDIMRYSKINRELLKAPNKELYKALRWEASLSNWRKISPKLTKEDFDWWDEKVRKNDDYPYPEELNRYGSLVYQKKYLKIHRKLKILYPQMARFFNNQEKNFLKKVTWPQIKRFGKEMPDSLTKEEFHWFDLQRNKKGSCTNFLIESPPQILDLGEILDYKLGNYLFDDKLYARLHQLTMKDKIVFVQMDLTNPIDMDKLANMLENFQSKISVLDMNNLYDEDYMGEEKFRQALKRLLTFGLKDSILILMKNYRRYSCIRFSFYVAFTFENAECWPELSFLNAFFDKLSPDTCSLLGGKLYEGKEELPLYILKSE